MRKRKKRKEKKKKKKKGRRGFLNPGWKMGGSLNPGNTAAAIVCRGSLNKYLSPRKRWYYLFMELEGRTENRCLDSFQEFLKRTSEIFRGEKKKKEITRPVKYRIRITIRNSIRVFDTRSG